VIRDFGFGEFYHLYNRGTEKRDIFLDDVDYRRFTSLLYFANSEKPADLKLQGRTLYERVEDREGKPLVELAAYCLMPNHFHLLVRACSEDGISRYIQKVSTGYTMYFNKRYDRSGTLFQGKFKASHVATDRYLSYLIAYIHLNPVKLIQPSWKETGITDQQRAERYLTTYPYSSFQDYSGRARLENILLAKDVLPESSPHFFQESVSEWLAYTRSDLV
jgi:putative transposase